MATWRELIALGIVFALLLLALFHVVQERELLCEHLNVPTRLLYEQPDTVNRMLKACGFDRNVHVSGLNDTEQQVAP